MKIAGLRLKNYHQFEDIYLDFTGPDGKPLEKVCFIGRNGTGKSTVLEIIHNFFRNAVHYRGTCFTIIQNDKKYYLFNIYGLNYLFSGEIDHEVGWFEKLTNDFCQSCKFLLCYCFFSYLSGPQ